MKAYAKNKNDKMKSMEEGKKQETWKKKELHVSTSIVVRVHTSLVIEWSCNRKGKKRVKTRFMLLVMCACLKEKRKLENTKNDDGETKKLTIVSNQAEE